jgi:hypothetical protein
MKNGKAAQGWLELLYIERYVPTKETEPLCIECVGICPPTVRQGSVCGGDVKYSITQIDTV